MTLLSEAAFKATLTAKMTDVTATGEAVVDVWAYVDALPDALGAGDVDRVYRNETGSHEHVLITTDTKNLYLAVVVDVGLSVVHGHHWLDLNREYGLAPPPA